jgi:hypothetical protein
MWLPEAAVMALVEGHPTLLVEVEVGEERVAPGTPEEVRTISGPP